MVVAPVVALALLLAGPARAYDFSTTHAGLTEQALLSSSLHRVMSQRFGKAMGLLESLALNSRTLQPDTRRTLWQRFEALDPAGGYRPGNDGAATALAWVVAGSVLAGTPPERARNHFFDPRTRRGLDDGPGLSGLSHALGLVLVGESSVRSLAAGTAFDLTGSSAWQWLFAAENDLGVPAFTSHMERAVAAPDPAERESALVQGLLALGGILAVLQDAGEPAHVRNDFRGSYLGGRAVDPPGSAFDRFVMARYGREAIPRPDKPISRPTLAGFFSARDGEGLADRTQRRFFSAGTLPADPIVDRQTSTKDVVGAARASLVQRRPTVGRLDLQEMGRKQYMLLEGRKTLAYVRVPGRVRFSLDQAVYEDAARALLPEVAAYCAGLVDHMFRASLAIVVANGTAAVTVENVAGAIAGGALRIYAEDARGLRQEISLPSAGAAAIAGGTQTVVDVPPGTRRIAAILSGDVAGDPVIAIGEAVVPPR